MNSTQTTNPTAYLAALLSRARGCLLGQLAGDSLGSLVKHQTFKLEAVRQSYIDWVLSKPFDIGHTTFAGLGGSPNHASEANGSLMANAARGICGRWHHRHRDARR